jgi:serine/threonine-protein phosphatase 6 regulatory subunit 3
MPVGFHLLSITVCTFLFYSIIPIKLLPHLMLEILFCSLRDKAQVEQLLRYVVEELPEDAEKKRSFKYDIVILCKRLKFDFLRHLISCRFPFIACEIFTCEIDVILRTLVEDEEVSIPIVLIPFLHNLIVIIMFCGSHIHYSLCCLPFSLSLLQLMDLLFSFVKPDHLHSTLLSGYFSKVTKLIINLNHPIIQICVSYLYQTL